MKKILLIAAATLAMSISSFGASFSTGLIFCGGALYNQAAEVVNGSNSFACSGFTVAPGFQLDSVILRYELDYTATNAGANTVTVEFNPSPNATYNPDPTVLVQAGNGSSGGPQVAFAADIASLFPISGPFNYVGASIVLTPSNFSFGSTGLVGASANVFVTYTYSDIPSTEGVPEPSTVALIGAGLIGVAAAARRRR